LEYAVRQITGKRNNFLTGSGMRLFCFEQALTNNWALQRFEYSGKESLTPKTGSKTIIDRIQVSCCYRLDDDKT